MSRDDIQKLLGGYATDTLSEQERRVLFEAALVDQDLFDALAKEQALRDVLQDLVARRQLLEALRPPQQPVKKGRWHWLWRPAILAPVGTVFLVITAVLIFRSGNPPEQQITQVPEYDVDVLRQQPETRKHVVIPFALAPKKAVPVVPPPPVLKPEYMNMARSGSAVAQMLPAIRSETLGRLQTATAQSSSSQADYIQSQAQPLGFVAGALPEASAKLMRAPSAKAAASLGIHYTLLRKGEDGQYAPIRGDAALRFGDSVRLRFVPSEAGYLHLFERNPGDGWQKLFTKSVLAGQPYLFPETGALQTGQPGLKQMVVALSRQADGPLANLENRLDNLALMPSAGLLNRAVVAGDSSNLAGGRAGQQNGILLITLDFQ